MSAFFDQIDRQEAHWRTLVNECIGAPATLLACSESSAHRRIYESNGLIYKIAFDDEKENALLYQNTLQEEHDLLVSLQALACVPEVVSYKKFDTYSVLVQKAIFGEKIGQFGDAVSKHSVSLRKVIKAVWTLNRHKVRHGDINKDNLIFTGGRQVMVIDYDQAVRTSVVSAFLGDVVGIGKWPARRSLLRFVSHMLYSRLPGLVRRNLKVGTWFRKMRRSAQAASPSPTDESDVIEAVWAEAQKSDANAPGENVSYYSLRLSGKVLPGERAWEPRWDSIVGAVEFRGKRLLELGCNLSLLSCYAQRQGARPEGMAVDYDNKIIGAARMMASVAGVPVNHRVIDFDGEDVWEQELGADRFDIVSALSVLHWLTNKDRFLKFIGQFKEIIYEGHDPIGVEFARLRSMGYANVRVICVSERGRVVLHGLKPQ